MSKKFLKLSGAILSLVLCFGLSACGSKDTDADTLKVLTNATFEPFEFCEDGSDEIKGFDVDMMNAIAEDQGLTLEFVNMEFDSLLPALDSNQGDIICAGMNKLAGDRAEKADFGETYYESDLVLLVKKDSFITGLYGLNKNDKVATQIGTTGADYANGMVSDNLIKEAVLLNDWADCYLQLQNGDVKAVIVDKPVCEAYLKKSGDNVMIAGDTFGDHEEYAFAVKKGNSELLAKLNAGLANLKANGKFDELVSKWFS